jgi:hypothetical protein
MFKPIGQVTLLITDEKTGQSRSITEYNTFTQRGYQTALNFSFGSLNLQFSPFARAERLYISSSTQTPDRYVTTVSGLIARCAPPGDATMVSWVEATDESPMYGELRGRLVPTGASRTFRTVVVGENAPDENAVGTTYLSTSAYAYVRFENNVTQGAFETIDIFYRVYFVNNVGLGLPKGGDLIRNIGRVLFGLADKIMSTDFYNNEASPRQTPSLTFLPNPINYNFWVSDISTNISSRPIGTNKGLSINRDVSRLLSNLEFKLGGNSVGLDAFTGRVINTLAVGNLDFTGLTAVAIQLVNLSRNPIQTSWGKKNNAVSAFYDATWSANGSGKMIPSGSWTGYYPDMYRIRIVDSGNIGVATYRLERQRFTHYSGNSWSQTPDVIPFLGYGYSRVPFTHSHGHQNHLNYKVFNDRTLIRWDSTGVTMIDILNGVYKNFDVNNDTTVSNANLPVTNIKQLEIFNGKIYVACSDSGLWEINPAGGTNSIIRLVTTPVYAVASAFNQTALDLFIVTNNGITNLSSNWSTFFNPSNANITSMGWANVFALVGCTSSNRPNAEFVIHLRNGSNFALVWWSRSIGNSSANSVTFNSFITDGIIPTEKAVQVSTFGDFWIFHVVSNHSFCANSFGSQATLNSNFTPANGDVRNVRRIGFFDENNFYYARQWLKNGVDNLFLSVRNNSDVEVKSVSILPQVLSDTLLYLGRNLFFVGGAIGVCSLEWESWGWNGSAWVKDHSGVKTTHADSQPILDGLSIKFQNGQTGVSFQSLDFYTLPVCYGVLGDNARYIEHYVTFSASEISQGSL